MIKKLQGWKTVAFGTFLMIAPDLLDVLQGLLGIDLAAFLPDAIAKRWASVIGIIVLALRFVTKTPVGHKGE